MSMLSRFAATGGGITDPYWANVSYLLVGNGANGTTTNIKDSSSNNLATTVNGSAVISTAQNKYDSGSVYFQGTAAYLSVPDSSVFTFSTQPFTLECWVYQTSNSGAQIYSYIMDKRAYGTSNLVGFLLSSGAPKLAYGGSEAGSSAAIPLNQWVYLAWSFDSGVLSIYVNGTRVFTTSGISIPSTPGVPLWIGRPNTYSYYLQGYLYDLRITNGVARYTGSTMTVPTAPLPIG